MAIALKDNSFRYLVPKMNAEMKGFCFDKHLNPLCTAVITISGVGSKAAAAQRNQRIWKFKLLPKQ